MYACLMVNVQGYDMGFQILMVVSSKIVVFQVVALYSLGCGFKDFRGTC
jgi:hypothetical protein